MWTMTEWGKVLMRWQNTTFIYHDEFNKYTKVEGTTLEELCLSLVVWVEKFLSEKEKRYLHELFEKWNP